MRKHLRLLARTFSVSASVMLMYRANIVFFLLFEGLFLAAQFLTVSVGFDLAGGAIAGWTRDEAYALTAVNGLSHQIFICFFINSIFSLGTQVWNGQFDYILLKPMHPLLSMLYNGQFIISNLPGLCLNVGAVVWLVARAGGGSPALIPAFAALVVLGVAVRVALALACVAPVFVSERMTDVEDTFWSVTTLGRYPLQVYPRGLELVLTFALPIGMLAAVPAGLLFGRVGVGTALGAGAASVVFSWLGVRLFMMGLARYQSVNSGV